MNFKKVTSLLISILITISVLSGCGSKLTFKQDDLVTRIEYAQLLFEKFYDNDELKSKEKTIKELSENQMPYADISADSDSYLYATLLFENCLIQDDELENNMLKPDEYITRETAVSWAVRMIGLSTEETYDIPGIKDNSYLIDIYTAISNDIISVESEFYPDNNPNYSELVDILNNSYNLYLEFNQVEEEYYNVEYAPSVKQIRYDNTKNIITENNDYSCVLSNISDDMKNLSHGTVVAIIDENNMHNNFIFKVESATYNENAVTIQKNNNIDIDEIVTDLNFNTSCIITAEDIDSSQLPEGITLMDEEPNYTASKKHLGTGSVSELSSGKKFKIKRRINDVVMLEGSFGLALAFSKVKYDKKKDQLIFKKEESYSLDLKVSASTDNIDKDLHGEFKWPIIPPLVFPTGAGDVEININTYLYGKVGGEIDVKGKLSYETGYIYKNKKISTIKKCTEKDMYIIPKEYDLEKKLDVFAEIGVLVDAKAYFLADTVHAGADFSGGARTEVDILDGLTHSCYSCYDGNIKLVGKIEPELSFGIGDDFRVDALKDVELLKIKIPLFDFYSSKKDIGENRKFGWGECPNKNKNDNKETAVNTEKTIDKNGYVTGTDAIQIDNKLITCGRLGIAMTDLETKQKTELYHAAMSGVEYISTNGNIIYMFDKKSNTAKKIDIDTGDVTNIRTLNLIEQGGEWSFCEFANNSLYFAWYYGTSIAEIYRLDLENNSFYSIGIGNPIYNINGSNGCIYNDKFYVTSKNYDEFNSVNLYYLNINSANNDSDKKWEKKNVIIEQKCGTFIYCAVIQDGNILIQKIDLKNGKENALQEIQDTDYTSIQKARDIVFNEAKLALDDYNIVQSKVSENEYHYTVELSNGDKSMPLISNKKIYPVGYYNGSVFYYTNFNDSLNHIYLNSKQVEFN